MSRRSPSYQALHVFLAVVDAGSIRIAAERLHRTESAVSHQMRTLERQLDHPLLERTPRGVRPTALGERYAELLREPFAEIQRATALLFEPEESQNLSIALSPVLASLWLVPRLAAFENDFPNLSLRLVTTDRWLDIVADALDIAIRYHPRHPAQTTGGRLFHERAFPVCSPAVAATAEALYAELRRGRILVNEAQADEWKRWRASLPEPIKLSRRRERLADSNLTLEAAAQGYGIAIGREPLVSDLLRRGRLVAPLGHDYPTGGVYELIGHPSAATTGARDRVLDWLAAQLGDSSVSAEPAEDSDSA